jgi:hypothetical protein
MSLLEKVNIKINRSTTKTRSHEGTAKKRSIMDMLVLQPFASCRNAFLLEAFLRVFVPSWWIFSCSSCVVASEHRVTA